MIRIVYSSGQFGGIDMSGSPPELRDVGGRITRFPGSPASSLAIPANADADPHPYDRTLSELVVRKGEGPTRVSVTADREMEVSGGYAALEVFVSYFDFGDDSPVGHHCHYEYFDGDDRIDPASVPLVISVRKAAIEG